MFIVDPGLVDIMDGRDNIPRTATLAIMDLASPIRRQESFEIPTRHYDTMPPFANIPTGARGTLRMRIGEPIPNDDESVRAVSSEYLSASVSTMRRRVSRKMWGLSRLLKRHSNSSR